MKKKMRKEKVKKRTQRENGEEESINMAEPSGIRVVLPLAFPCFLLILCCS